MRKKTTKCEYCKVWNNIPPNKRRNEISISGRKSNHYRLCPIVKEEVEGKTKGCKKELITKRLMELVYGISQIPIEKRLEKRVEANRLAHLANWENFSKHYIEAHNLALKVRKS